MQAVGRVTAGGLALARRTEEEEGLALVSSDLILPRHLPQATGLGTAMSCCPFRKKA